MDDLWVSPGTSVRRLRRTLKRPRVVDVTVEVYAADEVEAEGDERLLVGRDAIAYRAFSARINYISMDRPDLQYCSKEAGRCMAPPTVGDWDKLKKIGRYLRVRGRVAHFYAWQQRPTGLTVFVDSTWAGCVRTRRSTTGIALLYGNCLIRTISRTRPNIALSSAAAELYAMVHAASEGLGARAMAADFGLRLRPHLRVDASAAIGIAQRKGLGKVRHPDIQSLWIQDALRERRVSSEKVKGTENPADMMTKPLDAGPLEKMMAKVNLKILDGRARMAPRLTGADPEPMMT